MSCRQRASCLDTLVCRGAGCPQQCAYAQSMLPLAYKQTSGSWVTVRRGLMSLHAAANTAYQAGPRPPSLQPGNPILPALAQSQVLKAAVRQGFRCMCLRDAPEQGGGSACQGAGTKWSAARPAPGPPAPACRLLRQGIMNPGPEQHSRRCDIVKAGACCMHAATPGAATAHQCLTHRRPLQAGITQPRLKPRPADALPSLRQPTSSRSLTRAVP